MSFVNETLPPGYALIAPETWNAGYGHSDWWIQVLTPDNDGLTSDEFVHEDDARRWAWGHWVDSILGAYSWTRTDPEDPEDTTMAVISKRGCAQLCRRGSGEDFDYWLEAPITAEPHWHGDDELEALVRFAALSMALEGLAT